MGRLAHVRRCGTRPNVIQCRDGFRFSVIAGDSNFCTPRPGVHVSRAYTGPYYEVEVGFWGGDEPLPRKAWRRYLVFRPPGYFVGYVAVYAYVPVSLVYQLVKRHGGEVEPAGQPYDLQQRIERGWRNRSRQIASMIRRVDSLTRKMDTA